MLGNLAPLGLLRAVFISWVLFSLDANGAVANEAIEGVLAVEEEQPQVRSLQGSWRYFPGNFIPATQIPQLWKNGVKRPVPARAGTSEFMAYEKAGTLALQITRSRGDPSLWGINDLLAYTASEAHWVQEDEAGNWQSSSIMKTGEVAADPEKTHSRLATQLAPILWRGTQAYLVVYLSNPNGPAALFLPPNFGPLPLMQKKETAKRMESFLVLGMFSMIFLFNVGLFLQRPEDKESIWLAGCVLCLAARYMGTEFLYMFWVERPASWLLHFQQLAQVSMTAIGTAFYANFLRAQYTGYVRKSFLIAYWAACLLYALFHLLINSVGSPATWLYFLAPQLIFALYILKETFRAAFHRLTGSTYILLGLVFLLGGFINDFLVFTQAYKGFYLGHYGMVAWSVALSMSIGKQFAKAFRTARRLSRSLQEEVEQQTRNIRAVLENLRQGLFTFDGALKVMPHYSRYTESMLKEKMIADKPVLSLLFADSSVNEENISMVESALVSAIGEDAVAFELNQDHLPRELTKGKGEGRSFIELDWAPMLNDRNETYRVLVTMRDVTEIRRLKSINDQNQENLELIYRILSIDEQVFGDFILNAKSMIAECLQMSAAISTLNHEVIKVILINLHTVKGNARSYRLDHLTLKIHKLEHLCMEWLNHKHEALSVETLANELHAIKDLINHYDSINTKQLKRQANSEKIQIDRQEIFANLAALDRIHVRDHDPSSADNLQLIRTKLVDLAYCDPMLLVNEVRNLIERVARDLAREVPSLELSLVDVRLTPKAQVVLKHVFVHLVRNALDHGIESPSDRIKAHKSVRGVFRIKFEKAENNLLLNIEDDGRGMSLEKIRKKGMETQQIGAEESDPRKIAELIFHEGISTAEQVTEISGRGIGMASIRRFLLEHGASIDIVFDRPWKGEAYLPFRFVITLPPDAFINMGFKPLQQSLSSVS